MIRSSILKMLGTITYVLTQEPVSALTFDDGPHPLYTPRLLEILKRHQAKATFFMLGKMAQKYPEIVQQVAEAGHVIGNHTWDHPTFTQTRPSNRRWQIRACKKAIAPYGEKFFRPPYGDQSLSAQIDARLLGYQVVAWNTHAFDWLDQSPEWMADHIIKNIRPGSIILLHDAIHRSRQISPQYNRESMLAAVDMFLGQLSGHFRFITIKDLLKHGYVVRGKRWIGWK